MINVDDPYQFSMDESVNGTPRTRSSSRNRKQNNKKPSNKQKETNSKSDQQRVNTRSSQKSPLTSTHDQHDNSFMSNINSGFSQFVNTKKRQRDEKKTKTNNKRTKVNPYADENEPPTDEIRDIEQVKLIYETDRGRTNLNRAAVTNAQIVANRNASKSNTTYTINAIEDTQADTLTIPDTLVNISTQLNDSSWQRDIDRLMKKLEGPPVSINNKSQTQIQETQLDDEDNEQEENIQRVCPSPKVQIPSQRTTQLTKINTQSKTTTIQTNHIAIQTDSNESNSSQQHQCCQDVSNCPCVIKYSKLERLFMEKMSQFISIVPNTSNSNGIQRENHFKRRHFPSSSRFRRFRGHRRTHPHPQQQQRSVDKNSTETNQLEIEETSDQTITTTSNETINQSIKEQNEEQTSSEINQNKAFNHFQAIEDLSAIEKIDKTAIVDQTSTLLISTNTCATGRRLVLTTSSLDENQKSQFRLFLSRFNISSSSIVDSETTHVIVNENSPLVCPLTGKIIQGIARHLFVVSHRWLDECLNENSIVDERPFEIRGDTSLGSDHGGMRRSRLTPEYLLDKYSICLRCTSNDCAPLQNLEQVQELIPLTGAKLVKNFSEIKTLDNERQMVLVLGVNGFAGGDKKRQILLDTCQQFNVKCVNIHWLLISIAKFEIQPFENYDINQV